MTRETKIGLLVGLAFIIVIGILLSDYNRNEIQNAPLPQVADTLRSGTATLHNQSNQNEIVPPPAPIMPTRTVMSPQELRPREQVVNGGPSSLQARTDEHNGAPGSPMVTEIPPVGYGPQPRPFTPETEGPARIPDTVVVGPHAPHPPVVLPPAAPPPAAPTVNGAKQYVAVAGDTLSKLAGRFMGGNTKTNRDAIVAINPSLKSNPNNVVVGKTYMIPGAKTVVAVSNPVTPAHLLPVTPAPVPTDSQHYFYTVKDNDNLWKIASEQLGDGAAWTAIKELNKDILKGGEAVRPNMRLRLPAKPVASAS